MCFDKWRHASNYRNIVSRWTPTGRVGEKYDTGRRLYLAFAIPVWPLSLTNIDELAFPVRFDHEAEIRLAISVVLEIDRLLDLHINDLRTLDRYWPYQDGVKGYLSFLRQRLYMRPPFQEVIGPMEHSTDYSMETLHD